MAKRMLVFDFKQQEKAFFEANSFEDYDISFFEGSLDEKTLKNVSLSDKDDAQIISVFINSHINHEVIEAFENLKIIATRSTSCNHVNLEECVMHNVAVSNVTKYGAVTVVQYTFGLIVALVRKIVPAILDLKKLENNYENYVGRDLNTLTLGVVGTGLIGSQICKLANFLGMEIIAYDIKPRSELSDKFNVEYVDFDTLLIRSDLITLHVPYNDDNYHMFSSREFEKMKVSAYLINTSSGELVNTYALYKALKSNKIQGCALDVGECEDLSFDMANFLQKIPESTHNCLGRTLVLQKLLEHPNVIITPHIAYSTEEAIQDILETTMDNINMFFKGKKSNRVV